LRHFALLFATLVLAACSTAQIARSDSGAASATQVHTPDSQKASIDTVLQFLLTSAATDFHNHPPTQPVRFRDVRFGHMTSHEGEEHYLLCGQFLPAEKGTKAAWIPFVTIKTSGYEQWLGTQAAAFCQDSSVVWDSAADLSSSLQRRLDALQ